MVIQDCRGRYDSEGTWDPYVCEAADGYDTQQWVGQQPWCDGTIGTFGISYVGFTQILPAPFRSPYVKGLVPIAHQEDNFGHIYVDGVLQLQNALNFAWIGSRTVQSQVRELHDWSAQRWRLPLIEALDDLADRPIFRHFVSHPTFDDYWQSYSMKSKYPEVDVPALFITGWYDNLLHEGFKVFAGWRTARALGRDAPRRPSSSSGRGPTAGSGAASGSATSTSARRRDRPARAPPPLVRPAPARDRERHRRRAADPHLRDGRERLARRVGVAARAYPVHPVLPAQRRPRQLALRRRRS